MLLLVFIIAAVKTNAEMSRFRILGQTRPIPTYVIVINQRHRHTDRQREDTTVHRMVKCMPILLRDLEACSLN